MRYAVNLPNFADFADARAMADLAAAAEASGWDGFFVWDHITIADGERVGDPFVILTAIAAATERLTIGTLVTPLPRRRPWVLARQAVTLDHFSNGRLVLGVGIGFPPEEEFGTYGEPTDPGMRGDMLDEGLDVLEGMWSGEPFGYAGDHYTITATTFGPRPVQQPRIPIWVACTWPNMRPVRRAARFDGVYPLLDRDGMPDLIGADGIREVVGAISGMRPSMDGYDVCAPFIATGDVAVDRATAAELEEAGVTWAQVGTPPQGEGIEDAARWVAAGPPA